MKTVERLSRRLRRETAALHARAEDAARRWTPLDTAEGYVAFLSGLAAAHRRHAVALDQSSRLVGLPPRAAALGAALARDSGSSVLAPLRDPGSSATARLDAPWCLGVGYVFEGAGLGAAALLASDAAADWTSTVYLTAMRAEAPRRFKRYRAALDNGAQDGAAIVAAARRAFEDHIAAFQAAAAARQTAPASALGSL